MAEILHRLTVRSTPNRVFRALTDEKGIIRWWTRGAHCEPKEDTIGEFTFNDGRRKLRMKVIKLIPGRLVAWYCLGGDPEWESTQIAFEIKGHADGTCTLEFAHRNWRSSQGELPKSNFDWGHHLASLRAYLEKGRGFPARG